MHVVQNQHQTRCTLCLRASRPDHKLNIMFDLKSPSPVVNPRLASPPELSHPPAVPPVAAKPSRTAAQTPDCGSPAHSSAHVPHATVESARTPPPPSSHPDRL